MAKSGSTKDVNHSEPYCQEVSSPKCDQINPTTGSPCNIFFTRPRDLARHVTIVHSMIVLPRCLWVNPLTDQACNKVFTRSEHLTTHLKNVHGRREQEFRCHVCVRNNCFARKSDFTKHVRRYHTDAEVLVGTKGDLVTVGQHAPFRKSKSERDSAGSRVDPHRETAAPPLTREEVDAPVESRKTLGELEEQVLTWIGDVDPAAGKGHHRSLKGISKMIFPRVEMMRRILAYLSAMHEVMQSLRKLLGS